ncbi:MAG: PHP domain-containing protein [Mesotoga sp.]|uniref:PHP domain-containing protein n=1 Tax=Mesotoga sp. TaxID=2053577 RepID=UPI002609E80C|nr:PHP domain-containing protein [Mesotoga sp.]MDD4208291.1 PHP domain-containing protein [Mesotoga sp.]MDD5684052.1 PHP domain-containing protein [Mesotoga sp.]
MILTKLDYHLHTSYSDGEMSFPQLLEALEGNVNVCGVTDHFELNHPCSIEFTKEYLEAFGAFKEKALRLGISAHLGVETGLGKNGILLPHMMSEIEYIIASLHRVPLQGASSEEYWEAYKGIISDNARRGGFQILGHVEGYLPILPFLDRDPGFDKKREIERQIIEEYFTLDWYSRLAKDLEVNDIALEIHEPSKTPRLEVLDIMKRFGVAFSYGTDSHMPEQVSKRSYLKRVIRELDLKESDFLDIETIRSKT